MAAKVTLENGQGAADALLHPDTSAEEREKEKTTEVVSIGQLFRFADGWDYALMGLGTLSATICALAFPGLIILFGQITDSFIYHKRNEHLIEKLQMYESWYFFAQPVNYTALQVQDTITETMSEHCLHFTLIGIVFWVFAYCQVWMWSCTAARMCLKMRRAFFAAVVSQEAAWHDGEAPGALNNRLIDDITNVEAGIGDKLGIFVNQLLSGLFCIGLAFYKGWLLALVILSLAPLIILSSIFMAKALASASTDQAGAYADAGAVAQEALANVRTVAAFNGQGVEARRYKDRLSAAFRDAVRKGAVTGVGLAFTWFVIFSSYCLGFWYGHKLVLDQLLIFQDVCEKALMVVDFSDDPNPAPPLPIDVACLESKEGYTPGIMLMVFFGIMFGSFGIGTSFPNLTAFATARGAAKTVLDIIDRKSAIDAVREVEEGQKLESTEDLGVEFRNVSFAYPKRPDVHILNGLNLKLEPGKRVAVVGPSGCGKSTVVQLLQRFYEPASGSLSVGGVEASRLNLPWLRSQLGVVGQEPVLFDGSVLENIRNGRLEATEAECKAAAAAANAHDFIQRLPQKYETRVGARGGQLSGGQKQRIAIARALVRNPRILLLDEATSALDTHSEGIVQAALDHASEGRTTLVIAHRLSTIKNADRILVMGGGRVSEEGTHGELMGLDGVYAAMVRAQALLETEELGLEEDEIPTAEGAASNGDGPKRESLKRVQSTEAEEVQAAAVAPAAGLGRILAMNGKEWYWILLGCLGATFNGASQPLFGIIFGDMLGVFEIEDLDEQKKEALFFALMFLVIGAAAGIANFFQAFSFAISGESLTRRLRSRVFKALLRQDVAFFDVPEHATGALATKLSADASDVQGATGVRLGVILQALGSLVLGIGMAAFYGWKLTLIILAFVPFVMLGGALSMKLLTGFNAEAKEGLVEGGKLASESFLHIRTIISLGLEKKIIADYYDTLVKPYRKALTRSHVQGVSFGFSQAVMFFADAAAFFAGAHFVESGEMEFEGVMKVFGCILFSAMAAGQASSFAPDYTKARTAANEMFAILDRRPPIDAYDEGGKQPIEQVKGELELKDVHFSYANRASVEVLRGLDVSVSSGQTVALVGQSGCGKSTAVALILRFYDPTQGRITMEAQPLDALRLTWLRSQMAIVAQEPVLFDRTIRENIAYGRNSQELTMAERAKTGVESDGIPMNDIIAAAREANAHDFISQMPLGYETRVGQGGGQLSGGQKQRVAIARALLRRPKVLLLDEATSALDSQSERVVQEALDAAGHGRTVVVIAHRLSTIQGADLILVIEEGKVAESGSHAELMRLDGLYANLQKAQSLAV